MQKMKAVSHLKRFWRALACAQSIGSRSVSANNLGAGMLFEPLGQGGGFPIFQEIYRVMALQVHQNGSVAVTFLEGEIIHSKSAGCFDLRNWSSSFASEQSCSTTRHVQNSCKEGARPTSHCLSNSRLCLKKSFCGACVSVCQLGQSLRKNTPLALLLVAKESSYLDFEQHSASCDGCIGQRSFLAAMHSACRVLAEGAHCRESKNGNDEQDGQTTFGLGAVVPNLHSRKREI